jgi:5-methylcytosine-specific restriction endonuclease McrA
MQTKTCTRCGETKTATRQFFGGTPSGGLKGFCRECEKKASRLYEANNKERRRERDSKRAAAGGGARRSFGDDMKCVLFLKQNGLCPCCFRYIERSEIGVVDHVTPLARGGSDDASNLLLTHAQCNKEKHNKTLSEHWEWRVRHGLDIENLGRKYGLLRSADELTDQASPEQDV